MYLNSVLLSRSRKTDVHADEIVFDVLRRHPTRKKYVRFKREPHRDGDTKI